MLVLTVALSNLSCISRYAHTESIPACGRSVPLLCHAICPNRKCLHLETIVWHHAAAKKVCVKIVTGLEIGASGYIRVDVDSGSGFESPSGVDGIIHTAGSVVLERCYLRIIALQIAGTDTNAWMGAITFSTDGGRTYTGSWCTTCDGGGGSTLQLAVDADSTGLILASSQCLAAKLCTIQVPGVHTGCCTGIAYPRITRPPVFGPHPCKR